jgi:hypothetical protein
MPCIQTRRLSARLLVGWSHWISQCVRSLRLAARLLTVRIALALLRLCRASGRVVSPLDFSSVGRTGSCRESGHCVSWRDYLPSGLHQLYRAHAVHPDAPSRRSTSCQSVALALAVCPVIPLCVMTIRLAAATDTSCRLVVDYFAYAVRPGASARRAARHVARRRLLHLRRASGCLGTSRGSSRGSSSTTSTTPRVRVPRHVAWLVTRLIVDYSVRRDFVLWSRWLYFSHAVCRDYLSRGNTGSTSSTPRAATTPSSGRITSTIHLD